jgi:hypothetical protein
MNAKLMLSYDIFLFDRLASCKESHGGLGVSPKKKNRTKADGSTLAVLS